MIAHPHSAIDDRADDPSRGYEAESQSYIASRNAVIGVTRVERWAKSLPAGAAALDLGCGSGIPVTKVLVDLGLDVYALDASRSMVTAFRRNFPGLPVACEAVESSSFFSRSFDAAIAWGLLFLLDPPTQAMVILKVANALNPSGRFLFTAPAEAVEWMDIRTGTPSVSLGRDAYRELLSLAGLTLLAEHNDEGMNHYFEAQKTAEGVIQV